jgi:hypothetical protein
MTPDNFKLGLVTLRTGVYLRSSAAEPAGAFE